MSSDRKRGRGLEPLGQPFGERWLEQATEQQLLQTMRSLLQEWQQRQPGAANKGE